MQGEIQGVLHYLQCNVNAMEENILDWICVDDQHTSESINDDRQEDRAESDGDDVVEDHKEER